MIRFRRVIKGAPNRNDDIGEVEWIQENAILTRGQEGQDGEEGVGVEYIFTSKDNAAPITGARQLPRSNWAYDRSELVSGIRRGNQTYFDGTPTDLSEERPYMIRFQRAVPGAPERDEDIGSIDWIQEPAVKVVGEQGRAGFDGTTREAVYKAYTYEIGRAFTLTGLSAGEHTIQIRTRRGQNTSPLSNVVTFTIPSS